MRPTFIDDAPPLPGWHFLWGVETESGPTFRLSNDNRAHKAGEWVRFVRPPFTHHDAGPRLCVSGMHSGPRLYNALYYSHWLHSLDDLALTRTVSIGKGEMESPTFTKATREKRMVVGWIMNKEMKEVVDKLLKEKLEVYFQELMQAALPWSHGGDITTHEYLKAFRSGLEKLHSFLLKVADDYFPKPDEAYWMLTKFQELRVSVGCLPEGAEEVYNRYTIVAKYFLKAHYVPFLKRLLTVVEGYPSVPQVALLAALEVRVSAAMTWLPEWSEEKLESMMDSFLYHVKGGAE